VLGQATGNFRLIRFTTAGLGGSHHLPPYSILCASPWGPHPNGLFVSGLPKGSLETAKVGLPQLCKAIISCSYLQSGWGLKKSCSSYRDLSNGVLHSIFTHGSWVDSWLFVVRSQTANLTPSLSFYHNLCFSCPNGSFEPILDIYTSISFQWYKEIFNVRCFDLCNRSLKVWESIGTPTLKNENSLGSVSLHSHTLLGPRPWDPFSLVTSPRLRLQHHHAWAPTFWWII
jgi:hypothetical protein